MKKFKILILTDSAANPRSFPIEDKTELEDTYPYLLRKEFCESTFYQLSIGNVTTEDLLVQSISYLNHWNPDFIIIHSGINDCRPEAFYEYEKLIINKLTRRFYHIMKKIVFSPKLIKFRQVYRVKKKDFEKSAKRLKSIFDKSNIFWLEICADENYEINRPGVNKRIKEYNRILKEIFGDNLINIAETMKNHKGFNIDKLHWNIKGHKIAYEAIKDKINNH